MGAQYVRMSSLGGCRRQAAYAILEAPESDPTPEEGRNVMEFGRLAERVVVARLREEGFTVEDALDEQQEVRVEEGGVPFVGHPDGTLYRLGRNGERSLLEVKCLNAGAWSRWRVRGVAVAYPQYRAQTHGYMRGLGLDVTRFEAFNRNDGRRHQESMRFDPACWREVVARWAAVWPMIEGGQLPAPDFDGSDWHCSPRYCRWSSLCPAGKKHQATRLPEASGRTVDGRGDPEVEAAAEEWRQGNALKEQGYELMDAARARFRAVLSKHDARQIAMVNMSVWLEESARKTWDEAFLRRVLTPEQLQRALKVEQHQELRVRAVGNGV